MGTVLCFLSEASMAVVSVSSAKKEARNRPHASREPRAPNYSTLLKKAFVLSC